jgi:hypothetical protein
MPDINPSIPVVGQPDATEEPKIVTALTQLVAAVNDVDSAQITDGVIQSEDLQSALNDKLGLSAGTTVRRGVSIIAATESRTNVAYGTLTTPDQVSGIVLPTNGKIRIAYQATWQESVAGAARAAIFIGAVQQKVAMDTAPGAVAALTNGVSANIDQPLFTTATGLASEAAGGLGPSAYGGDVTTGQAIGFGSTGNVRIGQEFNGVPYSTFAGPLGGPVEIFAVAGTYIISVQFKASSGSVTAKNRKLWVETVGY